MPSFYTFLRARLPGAIVLASLALAGCGSSGGQDTFYLARALNLVTDSPGQTVDVGDLSFQIAFATGTGYSSAFAGSGEIEVRAFVPGANPGDPFEDTLVLKPAETIDLADATAYTVINYGTIGDFRSMTIAESVPEIVDASTIQLKFVHAAVGAGSVDIHVTSPGADLSAGSLTATLTTGQISTPSTESLDDYQIRITEPGTTNVIFDSGTITPGIPGTRLFVIGRTTGPTSVPVFLIRWPSQGPPLAISDVNTPIFVRLLHLIAGTDALDMFAEDDYDAAVASGTVFGELSDYGMATDTLPDGVSVTATTSVDFSATALDAEDGDLSSSLIWSSSIDGLLSGTGSEISTTLSPGSHSVVATVEDSGGLMGAAAVRVGVPAAEGAVPFVEVLSPPNGRTAPAGSSLDFTASAEDSEDGDIADSLVWTSSIDGTLAGTGASISATLSPGTHAVTASVLDSSGLSGAESVIVTITDTGNSAPEVTLTAPDFASIIELDVALSADNDSLILQNQFELFAGTAYTLFASESDGTPAARILTDSAQPVATHSLLRIVNASDIAGTIDVYVGSPGAAVADSALIFANVGAGFASSFGSIGAGDYDLNITSAASSDVLLTIPSISLANSQANTLALIDDDAGMQVDFLRIIE